MSQRLALGSGQYMISWDRDEVIEEYERKLKEARGWVRIIGFLHACSRFLAFCNLTWATVVLLGAFISYLTARDFAFVVCLLLLEGGRLASASFFLHLLMRPLAYSSQNPEHIHHGEDGHYSHSLCVRLFSYMVQFTLLVPSFVLPTIGHIFLDHHHNIHNLQNSLRIFYSSIALNSLVAILHLICSALAFASLYMAPYRDQPFYREQSILRYFDTVLDKAITSGLVGADDSEFFEFAYTMLGAEFRRYVRPEAVAKSHRKLIRYMYAHRTGVDFLQNYMDSQDTYVELAAVNMVGFWAETAWGIGIGRELKLPEQLVRKLANKVGIFGKVGRAACNSIGKLAGINPQWAEKLVNSSGVPMLDYMADIVDDSSSRSLFIVRTLARLCEQLCVNKQTPPLFRADVERNLATKLRNFAENAKVHRLRVQAAYLLALMRQPCDRSIIEAIHPSRSEKYWFQSEVKMLKWLLGHPLNTPVPQLATVLRIEEDHICINPPSWAVPSTVCTQ